MSFSMRIKLKSVLASSLTFSLLALPMPMYANPAETGAGGASAGDISVTVSGSTQEETVTSVTYDVYLRLMETTDIHTNLVNHDYYTLKDTDEFGLAKTATLIRQKRAEAKNSMLFDNGDLIQGNPLGDYVARVNPLQEGQVHPVYKAMNLLDYDAATLGNHEFNYGLEFLEKTLKGAEFPYVTSNVFVDDHDSDPNNDKPYITPWQILDKEVVDEAGNKHTLKVGVIGFVPPQIMQWDKTNLEGKVITKDIVDTARKQVEEIKAAGADIVVALAHTGAGSKTNYEPGAENAGYALAEQVPGLDAILLGHTHTTLKENNYNGVAMVQAGSWGNNLGIIDLKLRKDHEGKWTVLDDQTIVNTHPIFRKENGKTVPNVDADPSIVNAVSQEHSGTVAYVQQTIGKTSAPIYSYFAQVQDDPSIQIVTQAQKWYVEQKLQGTELQGLPILSVGAPFKLNTNIAAGDIAIKDTASLYYYPNTVSAVKITGAQVKEWLEMSAGQFNQIDPKSTAEQPLIKSGFPSYNFDVIDGVTYQIDVTQPAKYDNNGKVVNAGANRIKNLQFNGQPIDMNQEFVVITNNYRADGGGNFPGLKNNPSLLKISYPDENRQALIDYIKSQGTINPSADNNWSFAPINGNVNVTFTAASEGKNFLNGNDKIEYVGETSSAGYAKYSLKLGTGVPQGNNVKLQLLGINDLHGQLNVTGKVNSKNVGRADYLAAYLKQREAQNPNTLMVHAGDVVGASAPVSALLQDEPTIRILNKLGFDVGTVGNHEFDEGVEEMKRLIYGGSHPKTGNFEGASFPYVVANVVDKTTKEPILPPYTIKSVEGIQVGFIGVVLSDTPSIVIPSGVAGVEFTDEAEAINKYTAELKAKGVEAIVILAHNPGKSKADGTAAEGELVDIANRADDEVDVIFGGHNHALMNATVDGKLLVQSYSYGTAFSDVDLELDPVTKDIVSKKAEIVTTYQDGIQPDAEIKQMIDTYEAQVAPVINAKVGTAAQALSRTQNASGESALGNLIADAQRAEMKTDFAFMNPGGIRNDLEAGEVTWGELFNIQPFNNDLVKMTMSGAQIRQLLNQQWTANRMLQISGLKYTWDESRPVGSKVVDIFLPDGRKIDESANYSVTANSFLAGGGDNFTVFNSATNKVVGPVDIDALVNYVKSLQQPFRSSIEGRIKKVSTAQLSISGPAAVRKGGELHVAVNLGNMKDIYGASLTLSFDPQKLQVVDSDPSVEGYQMVASDLLNGAVIRNEVDNAAGTIKLAVSKLGETSGVDGAGSLGYIRFKVSDHAVGSVKVQPVEGAIQLANSQNESVPVQVTAMEVGISEQAGEIKLPASHHKAQWDAFTVRLKSNGTIVEENVTTDGIIALAHRVPGSYTLEVSAPRYKTTQVEVTIDLTGRVTFGQEVMMFIGDFNGDNAINIVDIMQIAQVYEKPVTDETKMYNVDARSESANVIDIHDIITVARNFGK